jgi:hypothetical protein
MGAYKQFLASDIIVAPLEVNKDFTFKGAAEFTGSNVGIDRFLGLNLTSSLFNPISDPTTGQISIQYQRLVYNSIEELYYSNYLSSSYSDQVNRPILIPGRDTEGNRLIGSSSNQAYDNYLQTTLSYPRFYPTGSDVTIGVLSIPNTLFGDYIQPHSFYYSFLSGSTKFEFTDDGEGNIIMLNSFYGTSSAIVGNITYPHGMVTLTGNPTIYDYMNLYNSGQIVSSLYATATYGNSSPAYVYGEFLNWDDIILNFVTSSNATCSFSSSYTIQETQYKCTIRENEYNFTLNPSTIKNGSTGSVYGYVTESYFSPYITTIGLYDEMQNLLAVGKLSQPLITSPTTDTTILINLDR